MLKNILNRDSALRPLSRDHGVLLVLAQKLQKAASSDAQRCAHLHKEIRAKLASLTKSYLADEDTALSQVGISEALWDKAARDHAEIIRSLEQLPNAGDHSHLRKHFDSLARLIDSHVRWDEHVLFPYIQDTTDTSPLSDIYMFTEVIESKRHRPTQRLHHSIDLNRATKTA